MSAYLGIQSVYANFCDILSFAFLGIGSAMLFSMYGAFARGIQGEIASYFQYYDQLYRKVSRAALAGATGPHWHFGPDKSAVSEFNYRLINKA